MLVDHVPDCVPDALDYEKPETDGTPTDSAPDATATPSGEDNLSIDPTQTAPATS